MSATIIIPGNITRDAEVRQAGQHQVVSFSVAVNLVVKGEKIAQFYDCSWFGERAVKASRYLEKGGRVTVVGEFSTDEYQGKTKLRCRVQDVTLMGSGNSGQRGAPPAPATNGGAFLESDYGDKGGDEDNFPFS